MVQLMLNIMQRELFIVVSNLWADLVLDTTMYWKQIQTYSIPDSIWVSIFYPRFDSTFRHIYSFHWSLRIFSNLRFEQFVDLTSFKKFFNSCENSWGFFNSNSAEKQSLKYLMWNVHRKKDTYTQHKCTSINWI